MFVSVRIARYAHYCYNCRLLKLGGANVVLKALNKILFGNDIAYQVDVPSSTRLPHQGLGLVIHPATRLGKNCTIHQNVTIGANGKSGYGREAPNIGNNVMIGAGAVILGKIKIGDGAVIGANAVVLTDIPENAVAVGVPAKVKYIKR